MTTEAPKQTLQIILDFIAEAQMDLGIAKASGFGTILLVLIVCISCWAHTAGKKNKK
ncbi:hypothetical protein [Gemmobacter serpentinus]|uniref:hypothetical protein n=1 Tax=Gemmobacter serpentinus TaxID=2652247 RepID=UPI00186585CC|nr:hypothetical protein [Gemmobacter serpentinus]